MNPSLLIKNTPVLNWRELAALIETFQQRMEPLFLERVIVPDRPRFPTGYLKGEWALRLTGRKREICLLFSVRSQHPYLVFIEGKGPRAAHQATHSAFDLSLSKQLKGAKLQEIQTLTRERTLILWFSHPTLSQARLGLVLNLIASAPEALLISAETKIPPQTGWPILMRSRPTQRKTAFYSPPDGSQAPENLPFREDLVRNPRGPEHFQQTIEHALEGEAFDLRLKAVEKKLKELIKLSSDRIQQSETAIREAQTEQDWQLLGDALKNSLGQLADCILDEKSKWIRIVPDYLTGKEVPVPCDPQLSPTEQVERFYQLARRKNRRIEEAHSRKESFSESRLRFQTLLEQLSKETLDWPELERMERAAQILPPTKTTSVGSTGKHQKGDHWLGKTFTSKDGWIICVGRNKTENLDLTFKRARGNDVWMHVRGRPGAHLLIPVQPGKSVSLETLLDAANLCIYYSGGENWGKTEVDYTFKKHVKRIKDSTEASYTHNKTLLVEPDALRLKRLLSAENLGKSHETKR